MTGRNRRVALSSMGESERPYARSIWNFFDLVSPIGLSLAGAANRTEFLDLNVGRCAVTNGCFDVLHPGHLSLLSSFDYVARMYGLRPVVAINSDVSVRHLKGPSRPIVTQRARAELIVSLRWPFSVVIFDGPSPQELMDLLQPLVVVKGAEYRQEDVVRWRESRVITVPMEGTWSTTGVLKGRDEKSSDSRGLDP